jgi:hypothetical protein
MRESIQRARRRPSWRLTTAVLLIAAGFAVFRPSVPVRAHEIPVSVHVLAFLRPSGDRLTVLLRLPLVSMRDFNFPMRDAVLLDVSRTAPILPDAARMWVIPALAVYEDDRRLGEPVVRALRLSLPSDRSFETYETARAHLLGPPLPDDVTVPVTDVLFDVMLEYPIASEGSRFSVDPQFARFGLRVRTTLRHVVEGGTERALHFAGDPGLVNLDPRWHQAALWFVREGFAHILDGIDHLLFLLCLVLPIRRFGQLVLIVTSFTVAHSITLAAAALGYAPDALWFPPMVETAIAVSIVYMAIENIVFAARGDGPAQGARLARRWMVTFAFGLVHGFGFSFALQETLQFAGSHLAASLVSFNIGVELGQLAVLVVLVPALALVFRFVVAERIGIVIASALVAHTAWHWMVERGSALGEYELSLADPAVLAMLLRAVMVVVAMVGVYWVLRLRAGGLK